MPTQPAYIPLRDFWARYFELTSRPAPPPRDPMVLKGYVGAVFGDLTEHHFEGLATLPVRLTCTGCRNNTAARRDTVCETHVGVLAGVFQAMSHVPTQASYAPDPDGACTITLRLAEIADRPVVPYAQRLAHLELGRWGGQAVLLDRTTGTTQPLDAAQALVMAALDQPRTPSELTGLTRMTETWIRPMLDHLYAQGWISCRFDAAAA